MSSNRCCLLIVVVVEAWHLEVHMYRGGGVVAAGCRWSGGVPLEGRELCMWGKRQGAAIEAGHIVDGDRSHRLRCRDRNEVVVVAVVVVVL